MSTALIADDEAPRARSLISQLDPSRFRRIHRSAIRGAGPIDNIRMNAP